ncbi:MAG: hypothetical protein ACI4S4_06305 [Candidatus Ornithospirochaeta sp.]
MTNTAKCALFIEKRHFRSGILPLVLLMPFAASLAFDTASRYFGASISPYSSLFVSILPLVSPVSLFFLSSMAMLTEKEDNVSPLLVLALGGRQYYMLSRTVLPSLIAFLSDIIVLWRYTTALENVLLSLTSLSLGLAICLATSTIASNRMEGMAITKLSGLVVLSSAVPYFSEKKIWWTVCALPTFWIGEGMMEGKASHLFIGFLLSILWLGGIFFYAKKRK